MSDSNRDINAALINAAKRGDTNEVKRLISEGADVNAVDQNGNTPLHLLLKMAIRI
ncbi:MAG: ankyrin repeat domain-containing protein [Wolbachia endosymbiont of Polyergus mexicanus]|uniref:Ankyrin repeat domain-containing protein n=1 Tax=Wolbachia endosymbiont of Polyergus mexicanus TaxID=3171167 RepID=A0AAU7YHJ3_9RICK